MAEWMTMAAPGQASAQVASFIGIQPVADPGQPMRLALAKPASATRQAAVEAPAAPVAVQPAPQVAEIAPPAPLPVAVAAAPAPVEVAHVAPPMPAAVDRGRSHYAAPKVQAPRAVAAKVAARAPRPALTTAARLTQSLPELRRNAALRTGSAAARWSSWALMIRAITLPGHGARPPAATPRCASSPR